MVYIHELHLRVPPRVCHLLLPRTRDTSYAPFSELPYLGDTGVCSESKMEEDFLSDHPELRPFVFSDVQLTGTTIAPVRMCVCLFVCVCIPTWITQ